MKEAYLVSEEECPCLTYLNIRGLCGCGPEHIDCQICEGSGIVRRPNLQAIADCTVVTYTVGPLGTFVACLAKIGLVRFETDLYLPDEPQVERH